jgi:hypothetical protein
LRRQALAWLRDELQARRRLLEGLAQASPSVPRDLRNWLEDLDFAGVREPNGQARLPEAERRAWQELWVEVADALAQAEGTTAPGQRAGR